MKKTFTLLLAAFISLSMYAYPTLSKITISSNADITVRVMVDGNRYKASNNSIMINNLQPGYHAVKVYQLVRNNRAASPYGNNSSNNYKLVYNANVYVKSQHHVDITINRFGKAFIDEQPMNAGYHDGAEDDDDWGDNNWNNNNDYNSNRAMNTQSFDNFKQTLRNESFDNTRINITKQVIASNYFTTAQIKEVLQLFSFENSKLDIAKYAYKSTLDKNNYFSLTDCFSFSSSKNELISYIQNYR